MSTSSPEFQPEPTAVPAPEGYVLRMPFVLVESVGGPFDDEAFTAGWTLGALDSAFKQAASVGAVPLPISVDTKYAPQIELIANRNGFTVIERPGFFEEFNEFEFAAATVSEQYAGSATEARVEEAAAHPEDLVERPGYDRGEGGFR